MLVEIEKKDWGRFFKEISKKRFAWETKIEVASDTTGKQILSNGLYLNGITFEDRSGNCEIEISVSKNKKHHQTHTVNDPVKVIFLSEDKFRDSQIEIIEGNATITSLRIFNPLPIMVGDASYQTI